MFTCCDIDVNICYLYLYIYEHRTSLYSFPYYSDTINHLVANRYVSFLCYRLFDNIWTIMFVSPATLIAQTITCICTHGTIVVHWVYIANLIYKNINYNCKINNSNNSNNVLMNNIFCKKKMIIAVNCNFNHDYWKQYCKKQNEVRILKTFFNIFP